MGIESGLGHNENAIEFFKGQETASVTFTQGRFKTRIEKLAKEYPEECQILARNKDGSIFAHIPVKWIKVSPPRTMSEEQREASREMLAKYRAERGTTRDEND